MIRLDKSQKKRMRQRVLDLVTFKLPPLVQVPVPSYVREAEWFCDSGLEQSLRVFAFPGFNLGAFSGKLLPTLQAWLIDEAAGKFDDRPIVLGATSGNWGKDSALIAPTFNVKWFCAVVNQGIPEGKVNHLRAAGAEIIFAPAGFPATDYAYQLAKQSGHHLIDQYIH